MLLAVALVLACQDAARNGAPAFVPAENPAAAASLREAAAQAKAGRFAEAAAAYQAVAEGPLALTLAAHDREPGTLEQARARAHREIALHPGLADDAGREALRAAYRGRFEPVAAGLLAEAGADPRSLRALWARFPLTPSGARAGLLLARAAARSGDAEGCLGILDVLLDLHGRAPATPSLPADALALRAAAAARAGDGDLLEECAAAAAALGADARCGDGTALRDRLAAARAALPPPAAAGPAGPLALRWTWSPAPVEAVPDPDDPAALRILRTDLPPPPDRLAAVSGERVYWADPDRVTCLDLRTGAVVARSAASVEGAPEGPGRGHRGDLFAPAVDGEDVVAALDLPGSSGRRAGSLCLFDRDLRLRARRGGDGDLEHPGLRRRYVFHGRPLLLGDRVYCAATESTPAGEGPAGGVRTHVLAFRRSDLALLWDAFVAYGAGLHDPSVAPAGTLGARRGRLYFSTNTGLHACLDARTGDLLWALRYRTPEEAPTPRLARAADLTMAPVAWYACPPAFSGELVAFAPRDSYALDFVHLRPLPGTGPGYGDAGRLRELEHRRPRLDAEAMTALWVIGGPRGTFLLAGQTAGREAAPLLQRDLDPAAAAAVPWRAALEEATVTGLPAAAAGAIYAATEKALYRVPFPGDGAAAVLCALRERSGEEKPRPAPGNLTVAGGWVIAAHEDGILAFGPPEGK